MHGPPSRFLACATSPASRTTSHHAHHTDAAASPSTHTDNAIDTTLTSVSGARCSLHTTHAPNPPPALLITTFPLGRGVARRTLRPTRRMAVRGQAGREIPERRLGECLHLRILRHPGVWSGRLLLQARHKVCVMGIAGPIEVLILSQYSDMGA